MRGLHYVSQRKKHDKLGTTRHQVPRTQFATKGTRDVVGEHQTKTEPFACRLGRHKWLEHALENIRGDCSTAIADGDAATDSLPLFSGGANQDRLLLDAF